MSQIHVSKGASSVRSILLLLLAVLLVYPVLVSYSITRALAQGNAPMNLVSDSIPDANGFDLNPKWAWQLTNPGVPNPNELCFKDGRFEGCTTDPVAFDEPRPPNSLTCAIGSESSIKGHINWRPVTFEGRIDWGEFALDGDYCFELTPPGNNALTLHRSTLHVEFSASETIKHFNTPWWKKFRKVVGIRKGLTSQEERTIVRGRRAIVIALLNLDCVHGCYTELHPAYALAINVETKGNPSDGTVDEVWAIFVRNWGNQGWCSQNQHYLNLEPNDNKIALLLPWGPDRPLGSSALSFEVMHDQTKFLSNNVQATGPELAIAGTQGILANFRLPKARDKARIHGELHLRWTFPPNLPKQLPVPASTSADTTVYSTQRKEVEEKLLVEALGPEGRERVADQEEAAAPDSVPQKVTTKMDFGLRHKLLTIFDKLTGTQRVVIQAPPPSQAPNVESEFDPEKAERDKRLLGTERRP